MNRCSGNERPSLPLRRFPEPQPEGPGGGASAGSWVLLQPERVNAYAQAVIRTLQADEHQRGCLMEERVLKGELAYESSKSLLVGEEDRFVLLAMLQALVERGV